MGWKESFKPLTNKCAKYLFLSKKRFKVWSGDSLKFLDNNITKNYIILLHSDNFFVPIVFTSTLSLFYGI